MTVRLAARNLPDKNTLHRDKIAAAQLKSGELMIILRGLLDDGDEEKTLRTMLAGASARDLDNQPCINRRFQNAGIQDESASLMFAVTPRIIIQEQ